MTKKFKIIKIRKFDEKKDSSITNYLYCIEYEKYLHSVGEMIKEIIDLNDFSDHVLTAISVGNNGEIELKRKQTDNFSTKIRTGANELFLFSILTGRIEMAKVFWEKGSVSLISMIFYSTVYNQSIYYFSFKNTIFLALLASKIFKKFAEYNEENSEVHEKDAK